MVAPAGYGKTTLAREWLQGKPHVWYQARVSSVDPAALASGLVSGTADSGFAIGGDLAVALGMVTPLDPATLTELVVNDLASLSPDATIAIDDVHLLRGSPSDDFLESLSERLPHRFLLTARIRPAWVSARRMLYGDFQEIGRHALALSHDEGRRILAHRAAGEVAGLMALADGWPAVIGLAAHMREPATAKAELPAALHDYFAEELLQVASPTIQEALCQLSIPPRIAGDVLLHLFETRAGSVADAGRDLGFLAPQVDGSLELHPLLRAFLERKLEEFGEPYVRSLALRCADYFLERREWDAAHSIITRHELREALPQLLLLATDDLLQSGRVGTLSEWVSSVPEGELAPELELVRAEVAFRDGAYLPAEAGAKRAALAFEEMHPWRSRAWCRAGQAAHFRDDAPRAVEYFSRARQTAANVADVKAALWGTFHASVDDQLDEARETLRLIADLDSADGSDELRYINGRVALAVRAGPIEVTLLDVDAALGLLESVDDPVVRTSFLNTATHVFLLGGHFRRALALAEQELSEARKFGLSFVLPHAIARKAMAEVGLGNFVSARETLDSDDGDLGDAYSRVILAGVRLRLAIASGSPEHVDALPDSVVAKASAATYSEYLASRALWHACKGELQMSIALLVRSVVASSSLEPRMFAASALAVIRLTADKRPKRSLERVAQLILATNCWEPLLCAIRGHPPLLLHLIDIEERLRRPLERIAEEALDEKLARALGVRLRLGPQVLTPREREVHALLGEGLTNKEIAGRLFITESTVKVHVRHLMEKLAAPTRTAAALQFRPAR